MSKAETTSITSRRRLFAAVPAAMVLTGASIGGAVQAATPSSDAELIRVCQQFAEAELASWYRYVVAPDHLADAQDIPPDWDALHWIAATPATSLDGWRAKALALAAWDRDSFDDPKDGGNHAPLLASLVREMAGPPRAVIFARLVEQYGPLPEGYTADGMWVGRASA